MNGDVAYSTPAPFMPDSNETYSHDVWYSLEQTDEVWLLTVGADSEWLASEDRVYPVTIDPTIIEDKNESQFVAGVASEIAYPGDFKVGAAVGYHDNGPDKDDYTGWQFASCVIVPSKDHQEKTLESITVILAYDLNMNRVSFDDISLRKEPCTTYTYDEKGNLTAVNATGNSEGPSSIMRATNDSPSPPANPWAPMSTSMRTTTTTSW